MKQSFVLAHDHVPPMFSFEDFRTGLPVGRFRLTIHPFLAQRYVHQKLFVMYLALPLLALGLLLFYYGNAWLGLPMMIVALVLNPLVRVNAPRILLFLAARSAEIYHQAIEQRIMEVRLAWFR